MKNNLWKILVLVFIVAGITLLVTYSEQLDATAIQNWIEEAGNAAPLLFMFVYIVGTVFFFPGAVLTLLGGALFGPVLGTVYNLTAATIGSMLSFLVARYLASDWVEKKTGGKLKQLINGVENEGWRFVAFTRLVPLFPFNLLNYGLGLTKIKFSHYSIATYIFMLPGAIAYTYLGYIGKEAATGGEGLIQKAMLALALLGLVAFLPRLIGSIRKGDMLNITNLKQRLDAGEDILLLDVRTAEDYDGEQGHIAGSTLVPLEQLEQRIDEISDYYEKTVVTICRTDRKSAKAAQILAEKGFADVHVVRMGMTDWIKNRYPVEKFST
ncbi:MAG: VTT domain-containing protein [Gammaproteobacteria bacterium]|nr:VTT domain-containing protein [Gammaproteobacteria bacterium]